jgi:hypothetical protein
VKARKCQALLWMVEKLSLQGSLTKEEYLSFFDISEITFKRYISEIRAYLANFHPEETLFYDRQRHRYILEREEKNISILF